MQINQQEFLSEVGKAVHIPLSLESETSNNRGTYVYKVVSDNGAAYALKFTSSQLNDPENAYNSVSVINNEIQFLRENKDLSDDLFVSSGSYNDIAWVLLNWINGERSSVYFQELKDTQQKQQYRIEFLALVKKIFLKVNKLHKQGFVHADLQPSHIFITTDNSVRLIDFGLTHLTTDKLFQYKGGMIHFNSPEVCSQMLQKTNNVQIDIVSEIYSVASVCYFLYTRKTTTQYGGRDIKDITFDEMLQMVIDSKVKTFSELGIEPFPELEALLMPCLSNNRSQRPTNLGHLLNS